MKVLKCNADIFFNKQCLTKQIVPNYANIKVPATSLAAHKTQSKAQLTRFKEEIKFLYKKKGKIKLVIGSVHVQNKGSLATHTKQRQYSYQLEYHRATKSCPIYNIQRQ
jgi:hypothetical protein